LRQVLDAAVGVSVTRGATADDDVAFLGAALIQEQLDRVVNRLSSHDEHHYAPGLLGHQHEVLDRVGTDNSLALGGCLASAGDA
jgi:hypothetical protein